VVEKVVAERREADHLPVDLGHPDLLVGEDDLSNPGEDILVTVRGREVGHALAARAYVNVGQGRRVHGRRSPERDLHRVTAPSPAAACRLEHPGAAFVRGCRRWVLDRLGDGGRPASRGGREVGSGQMHGDEWKWPASLDALVAAPDSHRLLFENDAVRVLETRIAPGQTTQLHTHRWPGILYVLSFGHFVRRDAEGRVLVDTRDGGPLPQPGAAIWTDSLPPHTLENVDASEVHVIGVEVKSG
jgi:hypothetical protein